MLSFNDDIDGTQNYVRTREAYVQNAFGNDENSKEDNSQLVNNIIDITLTRTKVSKPNYTSGKTSNGDDTRKTKTVHLPRKMPTQTFKCSICNKVYVRGGNLKKHIRTNHSDQRSNQLTASDEDETIVIQSLDITYEFERLEKSVSSYNDSLRDDKNEENENEKKKTKYIIMKGKQRIKNTMNV